LSYITGGGFNKQELLNSLASEGRFDAETRYLTIYVSMPKHENGSDIDIVVMLDSRVIGSINADGFDTVVHQP